MDEATRKKTLKYTDMDISKTEMQYMQGKELKLSMIVLYTGQCKDYYCENILIS